MPKETLESPVSFREKLVATGGKKPEKGLRQVNIRLDPPYYDRIERVAGLLGLDIAQLLRMVIRENFPVYEARAKRVELGEPPELPPPEE